MNSNAELKIEKCHNNGKIENTIGTYAGGLVGRDNAVTSKVTIKDSYNNGEVKTGRDSSSVVAGLIAASNGTLNITNSYNLKNISNLNNAKTTDIAVDVGGILGTKNKGTGIILNSYNIGDITGGNRTGGIVGLNVNNGKLIINNTYNNGIITANTTTPSYAIVGGGIVGYNNSSVSYIINSYNISEINSSSIAGGIIGNNNTNVTGKIINSYNVGNINGKGTSSGITNGGATNSNVYINNSYNLGEIITGNNRFGLGSFSASKEIINSYFNNKITGSNDSSLNTKYGMSENDMKTQTFVDTLNNNLATIDLKEIDSDLEGYILQKWKLGSDGYPVLDGEYIEDLSGSGHNGISYAVKHNEKGLTTSTDENNVGYVNCGFINYDFGDSISIVIRFKVNTLNKFQRLVNNMESAGIGIDYGDNNKIKFHIFDNELNPPAYTNPGESNTIFNNLDWYTVVGTYDGNNLSMYINGSLEKTISVNGKIKPSPMPILLGANPNKSNNSSIPNIESPAYATYSDFLLFDRGLSFEEIKENYSDIPNPVNKDELLLWYKF